MTEERRPRFHLWFWPLVLLSFAALANGIHTGARLRSESLTLDARFADQAKTMAEAQKLRAQLEAIASDTARLAQAGNANAIRLRDHLLEQGVVIRQPGEP